MESVEEMENLEEVGTLQTRKTLDPRELLLCPRSLLLWAYELQRNLCR